MINVRELVWLDVMTRGCTRMNDYTESENRIWQVVIPIKIEVEQRTRLLYPKIHMDLFGRSL